MQQGFNHCFQKTLCALRETKKVMNKKPLTEKAIISRIHKKTSSFYASVNSGGIRNDEWEKYFKTMMAYGNKLKFFQTQWKPRSKKFPAEFRELLK